MKSGTRRKAFVTGATGFIGSYLTTFLDRKGWNVIAGYQEPYPVSFAKVRNASFVPCDLRRRPRVAQLLAQYQPAYVFHLGAQSSAVESWRDPIATFESNVMGSLHLLEAIKQLRRPPVVVLACSSAEYGHVPVSSVPVRENQPLRPLSPYGISKLCMEMLAREYFRDYKIPVVNLRLFNTTGPGKTKDAPSDFVRQLVRIKKGLQPPLVQAGNLKSERAFLNVRDAVRGFYAAALKGKRGESYNLCGPKTYKISELLQTAMRISGVQAEIRSVAHLMRPSDEQIIFGSTKKFRKDTRWKPLLSMQKTLTSMLMYWHHKT